MEKQDIAIKKMSLMTACDRLSNLGVEYINKDENGDIRDSVLLRCEYAIKSGLHRGYYCPSPVLDLLVGNVKRGKLKCAVKNTEQPDITHCYHFEDSGRMICIEQFRNRILLCKEHLVYSGNTIHGISIDSSGNLLSVSEEQYTGNQIQAYLFGSFAVMNGATTCYDIRSEIYHYDSCGLCSVDIECYHPQTHLYRWDEMRFTRCNGLLSSYQIRSHTDHIGAQLNRTYTPRIKRKADSSFAPFRA